MQHWQAGRQAGGLTVEAVVMATDRVTSARARYVTTLLAVPPGQLPMMHSLQADGQKGGIGSNIGGCQRWG